MGEHWVVVGAGSAGCVLANRLSADPERQITLLDDGPDLVPGEVPTGVSGPNFFAALAEPGRMHSELLAVRAAGIEPTVYQRGRGIGGSSAVNAMIALRGSESLYRSWGWDDIDQAWDRVAIPTTIATDDEVGAMDRALRATEGGEAADMTRSGNLRVTSAQAYLWPVQDRPNLTVRPNAEVQSVLFDGRNATGVRLVNGTELKADRVIVSAGAIHSPTILLRSNVDTAGIGVGLQDHPSAVIAVLLKGHVEQDTNALAIASVLHTTIGENLIQLLPMSNLGSAPETARLGALMAALMTPVGRTGSVTISADGSPIVNFDLLADQRDLDALTHAVQLGLELLASAPFAEIVEAAYIDDIGTTTQALTDADAIKQWLRANCADYVHATSTCAMGRVVDQDGAVDGYRNLYVCDASIFPSIPDANTHFPTTMLAERIAARLR